MLPYLKTKVLKILSYLSIVLTPVIAALLWLGIFIGVNFLFDTWAAAKTGRLTRSYFAKMLTRVITSCIVYFIFILVAKGMDIVILRDKPLPLTVTQIAIGICSIREGKPIFENIGTILGIDIWGFLKSKIKISVK